MRSCRLHCPDLQTGSNRLAAEEFHHAVDVLRLGVGDSVVLFDGAGREGRGTILSVRTREVEIEVAEVIERPFDLCVRLTVAVAMTKAHRQNYLVEKCTELGVASLWPILTTRSVTRPGEAAIDKWTRRAIEAVKQCGRGWVPTIDPPRSLNQALGRTPEFAVAVVADIATNAPSFLDALSRTFDGDSVLVFIGPEGGWSDEERGAFRTNGVNPVALSPTILRTETAAVAACSAAVWQHLARSPRPVVR